MLALTVPSLTKAIGQTGLLGLFAGLDALAFLLVWLFVPGTAEVTTLEDMNYVFGVPTRRHVEYQLREVLPWWIGRLLGKKNKKPAPLYRWQRQKQRREMVSSVSAQNGNNVHQP